MNIGNNLISQIAEIKVEFLRFLSIEKFLNEFEEKNKKLIDIKPEGIFINFDIFLNHYRDRFSKYKHTILFEFSFTYQQQSWT